jgi:hypothetical protein
VYVHAKVRAPTPAGAGSVIVEGAPEDSPAAVFFDAYRLTQYFLGFVQQVVQIAPPFIDYRDIRGGVASPCRLHRQQEVKENHEREQSG